MKQIERGDLVMVTYDFTPQRINFTYNYPELGRLLIVLKDLINEEGDRCFFFEELNIPIPLNEPCFRLMQSEAEGDEILNEAYKIANRLP
jgi:hypothetical protein